MAAFDVRIENLEPMMIAMAHAVSESPERDAWKKMEAWADPIGLLDDPEKHPVYGFNKPNPSPDSNQYGYMFWIAIDPETVLGPGIELLEFSGGLYAVTSCNLLEEVSSEFFNREGHLESWKKLHDWVEQSRYQQGHHQALERHRDPKAALNDLVLDLYLPVAE